jgi:hypothetical protein
MSDNITYSWSIDSVDCISNENLVDVINMVYWTYTASDDTNTVYMYGSAHLDPPSSQDFIDFSAVQKIIVEGWLINKLNVEEMQINLAQKLYDLKYPKITNKKLAFS